MSQKGLTPTPGLHRIVEKDLPLAVKVTGRHLGAVAYLVSLAAERRGEMGSFSAVFKSDGSLSSLGIHDVVSVADPLRVVNVKRGEYIYLYPGEVFVTASASSDYHRTYRPIPL